MTERQRKKDKDKDKSVTKDVKLTIGCVLGLIFFDSASLGRVAINVEFRIRVTLRVQG